MKLIICGGRSYHLTEADYAKLDAIHKEHGVTEVVSGRAPGADACGELWAERNNIPVIPFAAKWNDIEGKSPNQIGQGKHGPYFKGAGHVRNLNMAVYADACAVFEGGNGTKSMRNLAKAHKLVVFDFRVS